MSQTTKTSKKTATLRVDAKTKKRLAKAGAALSELAGAFVEASASAPTRRR